MEAAEEGGVKERERGQHEAVDDSQKPNSPLHTAEAMG